MLFYPLTGGYTHIYFTFPITILFVIFAFGNLFAWVMPERLKKYLNRNYQESILEDYSENDIIEMIKGELSRGRDEK